MASSGIWKNCLYFIVSLLSESLEFSPVADPISFSEDEYHIAGIYLKVADRVALPVQRRHVRVYLFLVCQRLNSQDIAIHFQCIGIVGHGFAGCRIYDAIVDNAGRNGPDANRKDVEAGG